jgi:hypothetical protein
MTLAVAVVDINRSIVLASDSRITTLDGCPSDTQLKLMPLRIRIYAPSEPNQEPSRIYFERDYGMAFSGNSLGILQVKSCLELALRNLQYYPFFDVDFVDICDLVASLYQEISRNLIEDTTLGEIDFFCVALILATYLRRGWQDLGLLKMIASKSLLLGIPCSAQRSRPFMKSKPVSTPSAPVSINAFKPIRSLRALCDALQA